MRASSSLRAIMDGPSFHTPCKDLPDNNRRFFINDPVFRVIRIFRVAIRRMCCQVLPGLTLLSHSSDDLLAGVLHIELIDDVQKRREVIILLVGAVHTAVDGNEADVVLRKHHLGIEADLKVVATDAAHVLSKDDTDLPRFDQRDHPLPVGTVEVCAGITIVNEELDVLESLLAGIPFKDRSL